MGLVDNDGTMEEGLMKATLSMQLMLANLMKACLLDLLYYLNLHSIVENCFVQCLLFVQQQAVEVEGYEYSLLHFDHWYLLKEESFVVELIHFLRSLTPEVFRWPTFLDELEKPIACILEHQPLAEFQPQNFPYNQKQ